MSSAADVLDRINVVLEHLEAEAEGATGRAAEAYMELRAARAELAGLVRADEERHARARQVLASLEDSGAVARTHARLSRGVG